uniref:DNA-directed RNA polymerase III subunit RPC3 n=1 Tax=Sinocyclocheilus grahami TaxID=75366 RepID=A0A672LEB5_SINGR
MTAQEVRLCGLLLQEHFGDVVEKVGTHLIRRGVLTLRALAHETKLPLDLVKKSLCVLMQHGMCAFGAGRRGPAGPVEYHIICEHILHMNRYPRYIYTAKSLYGDTGELIVEEILQRGQMTMSSTVKTVADRLTHNMPEGQSMDYSEVVSAFSRLVETHFLQRCPPMASAGSSIKPRWLNCIYSGQGKRRRSSEDGEAEQRATKKAKTDNSERGGEGIYWQVTFQRFHLHFRDQAIISAVSCKLDQTSSEIVRTMLRMSEVKMPAHAAFTQALSANEVMDRHAYFCLISVQLIMNWLTLDPPPEIFWLFGSRSARIFRLLLRKRHLEQKQVEDFAMVPAKDMLYTLLSENLVELQEIPKTPDYAPSRTFYLYTVNQLPTFRLLLQHCFKVHIGNLIERRLYETKENKLDSSENQVDETIFLLESYINSTQAPP